MGRRTASERGPRAIRDAMNAARTSGRDPCDLSLGKLALSRS
ncbi:hypothetical protein ACMGDM_05575 [Sphingomonas sp. DT-51]